MKLIKLLIVSCLFLTSVTMAAPKDKWDSDFQLVDDVFRIDGGYYGSMADGTTSGAMSPVGGYNRRTSPLLKASFGTSLTVGCDGVNFSNIYRNRIGNYKAAVQQMVSDIPSMAIMWLAYNQPVIKSSIDHLNTSFEGLIGNSLMSCQAYASSLHAQQTSPQETAQRECTNDEGSPSLRCMGNFTGEKELQTAFDRNKEKLKSAFDQYNKQLPVPLVQTSGPDGKPLNNTAIPLDLTCYSNGIGETVDYRMIVLSKGQYPCDKFKSYGNLVTQFVGTKDNITASGDPVSVSNLFKERTQVYAAFVDLVAQGPVSQTDFQQLQAKDPALLAKYQNAFKDVSVRTGHVMSRDDLFAIASTKQLYPRKFISLRATLPSLLALAETKLAVEAISAAIYSGLSRSETKEDVFPHEKLSKLYELNISEMNTQLGRIETNNNMSRDINDLSLNIKKALQK